MCLIAIAYRTSARYPLVVAANRDESHARPSAAAAWWPDRPGVLGGRDLEAGGTWLALDRRGRFAAVTNLRDEPGRRGSGSGDAGDSAHRTPAPADGQRSQTLTPRQRAAPPAARPSRGLLVTRYLEASGSAAEFAAALGRDAAQYAPFNLLLCDRRELRYVSNRAPSRQLGAGIHAFSNTVAGNSWPKITRAAEGLERILEGEPTTAALLALLAQRARPDDPDPRRSALFQLDAAWGTRSSTVLLVRDDGRARLTERRFDAAGACVGEDSFEFELELEET